MDNIDERFRQSHMSDLGRVSEQISQTTNNDILKEIQTTNEHLKTMIDKMDEILIYLKGNITIS
jgi:DNA-binding ferritin-like protein